MSFSEHSEPALTAEILRLTRLRATLAHEANRPAAQRETAFVPGVTPVPYAAQDPQVGAACFQGEAGRDGEHQPKRVAELQVAKGAGVSREREHHAGKNMAHVFRDQVRPRQNVGGGRCAGL